MFMPSCVCDARLVSVGTPVVTGGDDVSSHCVTLAAAGLLPSAVECSCDSLKEDEEGALGNPSC